MKNIIVIISLLMFALNSLGQECKESDIVKSEINLRNAELVGIISRSAERIFPNDLLNHINAVRLAGRSTTIIIEIDDVSEEEYARLCTLPLNIDELRKLLPNVDFQIMLSCKRNNGENNIRASISTLSSLSPKVIDKKKQEETTNVLLTKFKIQKKKELLERLQRTAEFKEIQIAALEKEVLSNEMTVIYNTEKLVRKHIYPSDLTTIINNPVIQATIDGTADWITEDIAKEIGTEILNFENPVADWVDKIVNTVESAEWAAANTGLLPKTGLDKATIPINTISLKYAHTIFKYWDIFKSLPETGKIIGSSGAALTIYFDKRGLEKELNDYKKRIKALQLDISQYE